MQKDAETGLVNSNPEVCIGCGTCQKSCPYDAPRIDAELSKMCIRDRDNNEHPHTREQKDAEWEFVVKMSLICRDIMLGNETLHQLGWQEEANGRNAIAGGFQGQRMWTDWLPNGDFTEAFMNSSFNWQGKKQPTIFATENDMCNAMAMLFGNLLTGTASVFADIRTYWSPEAVERVTGRKPQGIAAGGFIHLINSGAAALDLSLIHI